jgi:membrane complex biogenesis BtpA family protein
MRVLQQKSDNPKELRMNFRQIFPPTTKPLIGMLHVRALPGTPTHHLPVAEIIRLAVEEAILYEQAGLDAILLENMHDVPYMNKHVGVEVTATLTAVACAVRRAVKLPLGIQILAAANKEALATALAAEMQFIRAEGFVFGHLADEGYMDACAGDLLRYRKLIGAEHIAILTDIKKKHSAHALTADVSIGETAAAAEFFRSDGLIVTGSATGKAADFAELTAVRKASKLPILIGSGITAENIRSYWDFADSFIIGSYFKTDGLWSNPISIERINKLMQTVR